VRDAESTKVNLRACLSKLLSLLLPSVPPEEINRTANQWVTAAVNFKLELSKAQVIYSYYWINFEEQFNIGSMSGPMQGAIGTGFHQGLLCVFPGLSRAAEDGRSHITIQAAVALSPVKV